MSAGPGHTHALASGSGEPSREIYRRISRASSRYSSHQLGFQSTLLLFPCPQRRFGAKLMFSIDFRPLHYVRPAVIPLCVPPREAHTTSLPPFTRAKRRVHLGVHAILDVDGGCKCGWKCGMYRCRMGECMICECKLQVSAHAYADDHDHGT